MGRRRWVPVLVAVLAASGGLADAAPQRAPAEEVQKAMTQSADYILRCQWPNGGIAMSPVASVWLVPYFADLAAIGLLRAYQQTKSAQYLQAVLRYADWHVAHQNADGTIYDFRGTREKPEPTGDYDSSDAYPALFLCLCWETYQVTGDRAWLRAHWPALQRSVAGIRLTWQPDGLTFAKPSHRVKYLMDNVEVRAGLRAAVRIAGALRDARRCTEWQALLEQNRRGLQALWMAREGRFAVALFEDGKRHDAFAKWYPDGMANAFAVAYLLSPADPLARALTDELERAFPGDADYWRFAALWKMGRREAAARVRDQFAAGLRYSVDHGLYLRALTPERETFFFGEETLRLPDLSPLPPASGAR